MDWDNPQDRINYFTNLRALLMDIDECLNFTYVGSDEALEARNPGLVQAQKILDRVLAKWNVYFIDVPGDPLPRVNLDAPP